MIAGYLWLGRVTVSTHSESFDVWQEVPLVQQLNGMSWWATAATMLVGWRERLDVEPEDVEPEDVVRGTGQSDAYAAGWSRPISARSPRRGAS